MNFHGKIVTLLDDNHSKCCLSLKVYFGFCQWFFIYTEGYPVQYADPGQHSCRESPSCKLQCWWFPLELDSEAACYTYLYFLWYCLVLLALLFKLRFNSTEYYVILQENSLKPMCHELYVCLDYFGHIEKGHVECWVCIQNMKNVLLKVYKSH